ncbi:MAG: hypothetical protein N4A36_03540 [Candidatus Gracilibacteria bacterium]|jgi:hypothetical protein|nr:hypothetical protein [Candidatus Gracilibacteria bacterium]
MIKQKFQNLKNLVLGSEDQKASKIAECSKIQNLYEDQFAIDKKAPKKILNGFLIFQIMWRVISKMKMLDYRLVCDALDPETTQTVNEVVDDIVKKSGFQNCFTEKNSGFFRALLFGDSFLRIGAGDEKEPIRFELCSISDIWIDPRAQEFRSKSSNFDVDEIAISHYYTIDQFKTYYPDFSNQDIRGDLPFFKDQDPDQQENYVQVAEYFSKSTETYQVFAGKDATILKDCIGEDYPFRDAKEKAYIPFLHFICFPSLNSIYNVGLGNLFYKLHEETRRLINMAISAVSERVDPIYTIAMKKNKVAEFQNWLYKAMEAKSRGDMGIIPVDIDDDGQLEYGKVNSIIGEQLTTEFERLYDQYDKIIKRIGINLDDFSATNDTARHAMIREENSNAFVKQIMEQNAEMFRFAIEATLTAIRDFIPHDNTIEVKEGITLGMISEILEKYEFRIEVDSRSGSYPSNVYEISKMDELLNILPIQSKAYQSTLVKKANLLGLNITSQDLI